MLMWSMRQGRTRPLADFFRYIRKEHFHANSSDSSLACDTVSD